MKRVWRFVSRIVCGIFGHNFLLPYKAKWYGTAKTTYWHVECGYCETNWRCPTYRSVRELTGRHRLHDRKRGHLRHWYQGKGKRRVK